MAMVSGIFTSQAVTDSQGNVTYDRAVDEDFLAMYMKGFFTDGVFPYPANNFQVMASSGMVLSVTSGKTLLQGRFAYDESATSVSIGASNASFGRYDRVVLRLDLVNRLISVKVKAGAAQTTPIAPELTRTSDIWELCLATVYVAKGAVDIPQSAITDTRRDSTLCGLVSPITAVIKPSDFEAQLNAVFMDWFNQCKNTLTEDAAGNLLNLYNMLNNTMDANITAVDEKVDDHILSVTNEKELLKQIIRVRMSGDIVRGWNKDGIVDSIPFRDTHRGGAKKTDWGELLSDGKVRIDKDGEYFVSLIAHISDCPSSQGTFHIGVTETKSSLIVAENYVHTSTYQYGHICSGTPSNRFKFYAGDIIKAFIVPPNATGGYRLDKKQTTLTVEPLWFD